MREKYRFNEKEHLHELLVDGEWKALTGCTTILKVIAKPALIQWAANCAVDYLKENYKPVFMSAADIVGYPEFYKVVNGNYVITPEILEEARKAHTKKKVKAGDYGTKTHKDIELIILRAIQDNKGYVQAEEMKNWEDKSIQNFVQWAIDNKVKFLESEKGVYSESLFLGGIVDFVCEIDGQVWISDIKTSGSGIYPENFAQCSGYQLMLQEMGLYPNIAGYIVLNLKENGEMIEKRSISNGNNTKFFLAALEIYRQQERIKAQTI